MGASPKVNGYIDYGAMFFKYDMLISALALFGSLLCFKNRQGILMVSFPFFFYLCYGKAAEVHPEWIMPVLPFMALLSAYSLTYLIGKIAISRAKKRYSLFLASLIVALPSIKNTINSELFVYMPDAGSFTAKWVSLKIPKDVKLLGPDLKLIDDGPILRKNGTIFFTPDFNKQIMQDYKGPTIKISGNITLPNYTGGIIKVSLRSKNYNPGSPPDIALIDVYKPGAYFLLAPVGYGEAIIRASYWETDASGRPRRSSQYMSIKIGKSDIGNIDLNISPIEADDKF